MCAIGRRCRRRSCRRCGPALRHRQQLAGEDAARNREAAFNRFAAASAPRWRSTRAARPGRAGPERLRPRSAWRRRSCWCAIGRAAAGAAAAAAARRQHCCQLPAASGSSQTRTVRVTRRGTATGSASCGACKRAMSAAAACATRTPLARWSASRLPCPSLPARGPPGRGGDARGACWRRPRRAWVSSPPPSATRARFSCCPASARPAPLATRRRSGPAPGAAARDARRKAPLVTM